MSCVFKKSLKDSLLLLVQFCLSPCFVICHFHSRYSPVSIPPRKPSTTVEEESIAAVQLYEFLSLIKVIIAFLSVQAWPPWSRAWPLTSRPGPRSRRKPGWRDGKKKGALNMSWRNEDYIFCSGTCCFWICVPEVSETSALLQSLSKHFIFAYVIVTDRATSKSHRLFEVVLPDLWHWIKVLILQIERGIMRTSHGDNTHSMCVSVCMCVFPVQRLKVTKRTAAL